MHFHPPTGKSYTDSEAYGWTGGQSHLPDHARQIAIDQGVRQREAADAEYRARELALIRSGAYLRTEGTSQVPTAPEEPWRPGFMSWLALVSLGLFITFVLLFSFASSQFYASTVMPYAAKQVLQERLANVGGFSKPESWPNRRAASYLEWSSVVTTENLSQRYIPKNRNRIEPWKRLSAWLKAECGRGVEAACADRYIAIKIGLIKFEELPALPKQGHRMRPRLEAIENGMQRDLSLWARSWGFAHDIAISLHRV